MNGPQITQLTDDELKQRVRQFDRAARAAKRRPDIHEAAELITVAGLLRLEQRRRADEREITAALVVLRRETA
ncbi:hypothetical protein MOQ72_35550 [Saccharopolyspora sp. K220]|uniref:hypothetical protein n=1 Tax=Saccharopolyspora soli TaxID=2926618 RepID=UPI001F5A0C70|nr:hypothetical protein [Saccharopolyspora soli]MCI2422755.1 hypothetical protein [Saccharopolyspora soli]